MARILHIVTRPSHDATTWTLRRTIRFTIRIRSMRLTTRRFVPMAASRHHSYRPTAVLSSTITASQEIGVRPGQACVSCVSNSISLAGSCTIFCMARQSQLRLRVGCSVIARCNGRRHERRATKNRICEIW